MQGVKHLTCRGRRPIELSRPPHHPNQLCSTDTTPTGKVGLRGVLHRVLCDAPA
jgi:hypothetical protein